MTIIRKVLKVCALVVLGAAAAGCVVLPYGRGGHGGYGRGDRHHLQEGDGRMGSMDTPRGEAGSAGK